MDHSKNVSTTTLSDVAIKHSDLCGSRIIFPNSLQLEAVVAQLECALNLVLSNG